jgi:hypothetical protein
MTRTDTELIPAPWLRPSVTATYRTPRARLTHIARRVAHSPFVADVRSRLHIIPEVVGAVAVLYVGMLVLRGLVVLAVIAGVR